MKNSAEGQVFCMPSIYKTVKRKLITGTKIVEETAEQDDFSQLFSIADEEKLLNVSRCSLSTTAGPTAGQLFISTVKVAFCSEIPLIFSSPSGDSIEALYKVIIPVMKIERAGQSENVKKPAEKYLEIVTVDNFDFWFMNVLNHQKTFKCIQQVIRGKTG